MPNFLGRCYEVFLKTALLMWNWREQNEDNSRWQEEQKKAVLVVDPIVQWLQGSVVQRNVDNMEFFHVLLPTLLP